MINAYGNIENRTALLCGAGASLLGVFGLAGWILHVPTLLQVAAGYSAMQFNTAIGLVIAGLGLSLVGRVMKLAAVCGMLAGALGAVTLLEYGVNVDFGIDKALFRPWLSAEVPGRMAINTAACFLIAGIALCCASLLPRISARAALCGGFALLIIAGSAMMGYWLKTEVAYRWGGQTRMAIHTAAAFVLIGAGLSRYGWRHLILNRTLWLSALTGAGVAGISFLTWAAAASDYRKMAGPRGIPDLMLVEGFARAFVFALVIYLWRNSRDRLFRVQILNSNLQDKVTERSAQLHAIFAAVRIGTWNHDLTSDRAIFQGRTREIFGLNQNQSDYAFDQILAAIHPDDQARFLESSRSAAEGRSENIDLEVRVVWPDDSVHWVLVQGGVSQYNDGKPVRLSGINLDVTRLKDAEIALQESEASVRKLNDALLKRVRVQTKELLESERRFRLMVAGLRDYAFFMLDTEGRVVSWNLGGERISGYTSEEIVGKQFSIMCTAEDADSGLPQEELRLAAANGRFEEEGWRVRRDGSRFWAHVLITAVQDDSGELCGFSEVMRDVTERKQTRDQLDEQRRQAEQSNQAKSRFLASMSHEIRTPMNAILGMTDLLWDTELDEDQRHYVEIFRRAGSNLMELINDILDLSKIEAGRLELEKAEFELRSVVREVVELLAPKAADKGIELRSRLADGLPERLVGDAARLRQVLVNLVGNAIKFTGSGEVVISVESREASRTGELSFVVSDTGIGIPKDKLATIFEAFSQVDASTARKYGGTGLGLPICQRLVECMGGVLRVESEPGKGSAFHFTAQFEIAKDSVPSATQTPSRPPAVVRSPERHASPSRSNTNSRGARILVAEDSMDNQFLIEAYLKNTPYLLKFVADGRAAVKQFEENEFDAVLMDMEMPVMDGLAATRAIREIEAARTRKAVPILALTANAHREAIEATQASGCNGHLSKPVSKAGLLRMVEELLTSSTRVSPPQEKVPDGVEALVPRYLSARRRELPEMVALLASSDFEQISSRGHNMKGTGRSYGFPDLTEIGAALEKSAEHHDKEAIDKQLLRLANYLESVSNPAEQPAAKPR